jgi:hypothetical protein
MANEAKDDEVHAANATMVVCDAIVLSDCNRSRLKASLQAQQLSKMNADKEV